mmetsp:Transcript_21603/g.43323  ORF Transcript_21603/g.43323 Transcript_21603/m.43323 type:complete len:228 (+) Transcript_21603:1886-2569(+)
MVFNSACDWRISSSIVPFLSCCLGCSPRSVTMLDSPFCLFSNAASLFPNAARSMAFSKINLTVSGASSVVRFNSTDFFGGVDKLSNERLDQSRPAIFCTSSAIFDMSFSSLRTSIFGKVTQFRRSNTASISSISLVRATNAWPAKWSIASFCCCIKSARFISSIFSKSSVIESSCSGASTERRAASLACGGGGCRVLGRLFDREMAWNFFSVNSTYSWSVSDNFFFS